MSDPTVEPSVSYSIHGFKADMQAKQTMKENRKGHWLTSHLPVYNDPTFSPSPLSLSLTSVFWLFSHVWLYIKPTFGQQEDHPLCLVVCFTTWEGLDYWGKRVFRKKKLTIRYFVETKYFLKRFQRFKENLKPSFNISKLSWGAPSQFLPFKLS